MRAIYKRAIMAGLAGALIMLGLLAFCMFMADRDMKEYYKVPRGYDNDFVGFQWILLFIAGSLGTFGVIGALAAFLTAGQATSIRDTIRASAMAGAVPLLLLTIGILAYIIALVGGAILKGPGEAVIAIFSVLFMSVFVIVQYGMFILVCLAISVIGGIIYTTVGKPTRKEKRGVKFSYRQPIIAGLAGGLIVFAMFMAGHVATGGQYSMPLNFLEELLFLILSVAAGGMAVHMLKTRDIRIIDALKAALVAGGLTGAAGAAGNVAGAVIRQYNVAGILLETGTKYFLNGLVMAAVGGLLYVALTWPVRAGGVAATGKPAYMKAIKVGLLAGAAMATYSVLSGLAFAAVSLLNAGSQTATIVNLCMITSGLPGQLVMFAIMAGGAIFAVRQSSVRTLNSAITIAAIVGALTGLATIVGDTINRFLNLWYTPYGPADFRSADLITSNLSGVLDCAPTKTLIFIAICALAGTIYGAWILRLKFAGDESTGELQTDGGQ